MLEEHYSNQLQELIGSIEWDIELPLEWMDYFQERGEIASQADDDRSNLRLKARTHGVLWFDRPIFFRPRALGPVGVYTRDFSRNGIGFLSPVEIFPEEHVRVVLPTFWVQLCVVRARRITSKCFETGTTLIRRYDPSLDAFAGSCLSVSSPQ